MDKHIEKKKFTFESPNIEGNQKRIYNEAFKRSRGRPHPFVSREEKVYITKFSDEKLRN